MVMAIVVLLVGVLVVVQLAAASVETATDSYIFGFPLVMTLLTLGDTPRNRFYHAVSFATPDSNWVVRPNVDTLYSSACLEIGEESYTLVVPNTDADDSMYYLIPIMDGWTNVIDSPGWRTTGKAAARILLAGPFSDLSFIDEDDFDHVIHSRTTHGFVIGRTNVADQTDLTPSRQQMREYLLELNNPDGTTTPIEPLYSDVFAPTAMVNHHHAITGGSRRRQSETPVEHILDMPAEEFFPLMSHLMAIDLPDPLVDAEIIAQMNAEFGLYPGDESFSWDSLSAQQQQELEQGRLLGLRQLFNFSSDDQDGWTVPNMDAGNYSSNYYLRASIALWGYGANVPADTVYYSSRGTIEVGGSYELLFAAGQAPPNSAFWSVTAYDSSGFLIDNEYDRYAVSSQSFFLVTRPDGSISITIAPVEPADATTNWLPVPADESFSLTIRVYWPDEEVISMEWFPPALVPLST